VTANYAKWAADTGQLESFPDRMLEFAVDETKTPAELTIFDPNWENFASSWITVDRDSGVRIDQML